MNDKLKQTPPHRRISGTIDNLFQFSMLYRTLFIFIGNIMMLNHNLIFDLGPCPTVQESPDEGPPTCNDV